MTHRNLHACGLCCLGYHGKDLVYPGIKAREVMEELVPAVNQFTGTVD